uniref:Uncharacterized protein n=1 Tax=Octopus bimaculoides TaxID=37653 RepID=A0A0L8IES8_OCTBM
MDQQTNQLYPVFVFVNRHIIITGACNNLLLGIFGGEMLAGVWEKEQRNETQRSTENIPSM